MTEDDRIRELLREMRDDAVPADSLARVRLAVERRTAPRSRWAWWCMSAAVAMAGLMLVWPARPPVREEPPPAPSPVARVVEAPPTVTLPVRRKRLPKIKPPESIAIRIETADPDVVFLMVNSGAE